MRIRTLIAVATLALALSFQAAAQAPDANTLVIAQSVDASTMDPADISSRPGANIAAHLWGTLVRTTSTAWFSACRTSVLWMAAPPSLAAAKSSRRLKPT
jgi:ABC-type oligopeptide transport system substrate-binding subunit